MYVKLLLAGILSFFSLSNYAQEDPPQHILPGELQIKIAVMAAPEAFRENATVLGYDPQGELIELRKGSNDYICLAPDYRRPQYFASYCYPKSLEPMMKRGRELIAEGKRRDRDKIRAREIEEGKLSFPKQPTTLYGYWGTLDSLNRETGEMADAKRRYVIYIPFAKAEDLGLSNKPNNLGMPWLMDEGTYKAHIMITPPMDHKHGR
ncbi:hypothetical protein SAMN02927921_03597 [Sinomicrobium oceani]|uniref:Uncharacterized protein n=1 Tax=Sinomicrobium oceani TaxID=1150368 RepID=A0A1K1RJ93_9FLAO|nr:hypothetical protein [Sinomicrobium oceani]SFW71766.1 hypothetical protein SAMN02927921_03597 [Sinomicrobium oceani]